ncbi:uncharacterized protein LOC129743292 [Uranotaenia lowii]|uniref:uncharacterized protein LOC129743292 n=1 Tax=Uranotaenia lowii TaxID=190385 RepID=UPI00247970D4|nr:uncharacterized protein LOC129743292 [Uranotaenia lowii]
MWSSEKVLRFIEDYQSMPCLWDVKNKDYKNRIKRKLARESLAVKFNESVSEIEKKIHNLKTSYNRERKKTCTASGSSPKESSWFAFKYLQFLQPAIEPKKTRNTDLDDTQDENDTNEISLLNSSDYHEDQNEEPLSVDDAERPSSSKRIKKHDSPAEQAVKCMKMLCDNVSARDEYSAFGDYIANKLRNSSRPKMETAVAQKKMNDILFELDLGLLAREIPHDVPRDIPCAIPCQMPREIPREILHDIPRATRRSNPREISREIPQEISSGI